MTKYRPMKRLAPRLFLGGLFTCMIHFVGAQTVPEGKCLILNGIDQHMIIPDHPDFNLMPGESYTIAFRFEPVNFDAQYSLISKGNQMMPGSRYELFTQHTVNTPNLGIYLKNSENTYLGANYVTTLEAAKWVHVAWVYNAAERTSQVFINGQVVNTVSSNQIGKKQVVNTADIHIGCALTDDTEPRIFQFFPGCMDEIRIWKRALSGYELMADKGTANPIRTGLVAAYDFENITGQVVPDISGNGHPAQLVGYGIRVVKPQLPAGIGNTDERLVGFRIFAENEHDQLRSVTVNLSGTDDIGDLQRLKVYFNGHKERLDLKNARLFGSAKPLGNKTVISGSIDLLPGENYFWLTADISPLALEGHKIMTTVGSVHTAAGSILSMPDPEGSRTILLTHSLLFSGGDWGSSNYRIPAMITADDGSLVTATDRRNNSAHDLPSDIDLVIRRSTDKGKTWSRPYVLAGGNTETGYGDAALVLNRRNGEILCLFNGDKGFFSSTAAEPIRIYLSKSQDNGITWSNPVDLTDQIYGERSANPQTRTWQGAFVTSGAAVQFRGGRIAAVMPVRENRTRFISNYILYSDDGGNTWMVSPNKALSGGNEGKLVELENGVILMSVRNEGSRIFNLSKDYGMTWGSPFAQSDITDPACNGDMIRYTSVADGYEKNRILHSIPYSATRKNVSVLLSYNEGETWPARRTIYPDASAYSALTVLPDGTIGIYYEAGEYETYQMYFARFSLDWLSQYSDTWRAKLNHGTGIQTISEDPPWNLYPNPASEEVTITGTFTGEEIIEIIDSRGRVIQRKAMAFPASVIKVDVTGLAPGIYLLRIDRKVSRLVINR